MLLQVHDELVLEVAAGERETVEKLVTEQMAGAADLSVPLDVQIGVGPSWYDAGH
jgi:DNA polymerase I